MGVGGPHAVNMWSQKNLTHDKVKLLSYLKNLLSYEFHYDIFFAVLEVEPRAFYMLWPLSCITVHKCQIIKIRLIMICFIEI